MEHNRGIDGDVGSWHGGCREEKWIETLHREQEPDMIDKNNIIGYLESGIRAEALRQKAIASNVANSQTPGYRRLDVQFSALMEEAMSGGAEVEPEELAGQVFKPMTTPVDSKGNDVSLDSEIGELVKNTLTQKAYMKLLANKYRQLESAMSTGSGG
jgi:flagellar basal-body rod protein FlgB